MDINVLYDLEHVSSYYLIHVSLDSCYVDSDKRINQSKIVN